jgi:hypothetical protein
MIEGVTSTNIHGIISIYFLAIIHYLPQLASFFVPDHNNTILSISISATNIVYMQYLLLPNVFLFILV